MKRIFLLLIICGSLLDLYAVEIPVAQFAVVTNGITSHGAEIASASLSQGIFNQIISLDQAGAIGFTYRDSNATGGMVLSQIDAAKTCEIYGWETLVYGQLTFQEYGYDVEIKIYNHVTRQIEHSFLLRSATADFDHLINDCARRLYDYFAEALKISAHAAPVNQDGNSVVTSHTLEWWGVIPPWLDSVVPIAGYHGTVGIRLGKPLWSNGEWTWIEEFGLGVGFHWALSKPTVVSAQWYDIDLGPSATWAFVWQRQQEIRVTLEPGVKIHILNYLPLYGSSQVHAVTWYGGQLDLEYRFWLDTERTFGIGLEGGVAGYFTNPFYLDYRVGVDFAFKGKNQ